MPVKGDTIVGFGTTILALAGSAPTSGALSGSSLSEVSSASPALSGALPQPVRTF
jgi:hypothetical protein